MLSAFGTVFVFIVTGIVLVLLLLFVAKLIAPDNPTPEKLLSYECGMAPASDSWAQFNPRFYVIALVFLLFDVELAFIFPVATVFADEQLLQADARWGWLSFGEIFVFVAILFLGLLYAWYKGDLEWIKPRPNRLSVHVPLRPALYEHLNAEVYEVVPFLPDKIQPTAPATPAAATTSATAPPARKPLFKSTFKKPDEPGKTTG